MTEPESVMVAKHVDPYRLPADQQGWRGLGVPGAHKRKWYTVLYNEQVLVTALLLIPGERSIRHSHESGELSIHYFGDLNPEVTWNPPGMLHPSPSQPPAERAALEQMVTEAAAQSAGNPGVGRLLHGLLEEQLRLRERLEEVLRPRPSPFVIVDILFPPFKTTIDDPAAPEQRTVVGQWYD
jgi:hypothetical protein